MAQLAAIKKMRKLTWPASVKTKKGNPEVAFFIGKKDLGSGCVFVKVHGVLNELAAGQQPEKPIIKNKETTCLQIGFGCQ